MLYECYFYYYKMKFENPCINKDINSNAIEHEPLILPYLNLICYLKKKKFGFFFFLHNLVIKKLF